MDILRTVAPIGGLSMIAECYLSFGIAGVVFLGLLTATLTGFFHLRLLKFYSLQQFSAANILIVSVGCVLLGKYRSGISDAFLVFTSMSILFAALYLLAMFLDAVIFRNLVHVRQKSESEL